MLAPSALHCGSLLSPSSSVSRFVVPLTRSVTQRSLVPRPTPNAPYATRRPSGEMRGVHGRFAAIVRWGRPPRSTTRSSVCRRVRRWPRHASRDRWGHGFWVAARGPSGEPRAREQAATDATDDERGDDRIDRRPRGHDASARPCVRLAPARGSTRQAALLPNARLPARRCRRPP